MDEYRRMRLLNPGPVTLSRRVREALPGVDLCHREPEFALLQQDVRLRLARVYHDAEKDCSAVLLTGSGTAAVESMVGTLVPRESTALVAANGVYGERIAAMLEVQGKKCEMVRSEWTEPLNLTDVKRRLDADRGISHVLSVHHETTTGRLNDIPALGDICRERNVGLLLDAVSSFGGEEIDFTNWNLEACASTANKCLHGVPGISFVILRKDVFQSRRSASGSLYLDLFKNHEEQSKGYPLFTPSVQVLFALQEALRELEESGGWRHRRSHYRQLSGVLRAGMRKLGLALLLQDERHYSSILTSCYLPKGLDFEDLFSQLKRSGYVIYPGQRSLLASIFRIAVMGDLSIQDMHEFVDALAAILQLRQNGTVG